MERKIFSEFCKITDEEDYVYLSSNEMITTISVSSGLSLCFKQNYATGRESLFLKKTLPDGNVFEYGRTSVTFFTKVLKLNILHGKDGFLLVQDCVNPLCVSEINFVEKYAECNYVVKYCYAHLLHLRLGQLTSQESLLDYFSWNRFVTPVKCSWV